MEPYFSPDELLNSGFAQLGKNVRISRKCSIYGAANISIGHHVRIDDFCVITASEPLVLGNFVHISCLSFLHGYRSIRIGDFSQISSRVGLYTSSADCSGESFTNPLLPRGTGGSVPAGEINIGEYVIVGTGATVLQNVNLGEGAVLGANSLANRSIPAWTIWAGSPARQLKTRKKETVLAEGELIRNHHL